MPIGKHYDLDTDGTLANNSDNTIASQKAVKTYVDNNKPLVNNSTILLTQGGANKGSFTLNQPTDSIIDLDKSSEIIFVDDSGATLPTPQTIGIKFLNTIDKKIYTSEPGKYVVGTGLLKNGNLDVSTGSITGFSSTDYLYSTSSSRYEATSNLDIHFKTSLDVTTKQCFINYRLVNTSTHKRYGMGAIYIENGKLYVLRSASTGTINEICDIQINTDYHIESSITSMYNTYYLSGLKVKENDVYISTLTSYVVFGYPSYSPNESCTMYMGVYIGDSLSLSAPFLGTLYGDTNWGGTILENEGETGWNDGVALSHDTICYDKTNNITYLYQNNVLYNINELPSQSGNNGKFLTTNGSTVSWATVTIPTVNDAVLTIQQNGTTMATFSANASTNTTLDMSTTVVKFREWSD